MCNVIKIVFEHFILLRVYEQYTYIHTTHTRAHAHTHTHTVNVRKTFDGDPAATVSDAGNEQITRKQLGMIGVTPGKRRPAKSFENEKSVLRRNAHVEPDRIRLSIRMYNARIVENQNVYVYDTCTRAHKYRCASADYISFWSSDDGPWLASYVFGAKRIAAHVRAHDCPSATFRSPLRTRHCRAP